MLDISCCCILSMTAVCIGTTSGKPMNWRASTGVQSISMLTFMSAPTRVKRPLLQYRRDRYCDASGPGTG